MTAGLKKAKQITFFGNGRDSFDSLVYSEMAEAGRLVAERGGIVVTGGYSGSGMEAPARGASAVRGKTIGYIMSSCPAVSNPWIEEELICRGGQIPSTPGTIEDQFGNRMISLLTASEGFIFGSGGGAEAMAMLFVVIHFNSQIWHDEPRRIAVLNPSSPGEGGDTGWSVEMFRALAKWELIPTSVFGSILVTPSSEQAVSWAFGD